MRRWVWAVAVLAAACRTALPPASPEGFQEEGLASWYGEPYHGRPAASGERYDMYAMTAAHRSLPFGTLLQVTNLENGRQVEVTVNDRGPFVRGRILDLSWAAAKKLDMLAQGVVPVRLRVLRLGDGMVNAPCWEVQVGAFAQEANVRAAVNRLKALGFAWRTAPAGGGLTRVRATGLGGFPQAQAAAKILGKDFPGAMAVPCGPMGAGKP